MQLVRREKSVKSRIPRARLGPSQSKGTAYPPQFEGARMVGDKCRFVLNAGITYANATGFERATFLNMWCLVNVTNTSGWRIFQGVKIRKIEMWNPVSAGSTTADAGLEWYSEYGPPKTLACITEGLARPGHLSSKPPKQSLGAFWSLTGSSESDVVVYIWGPAGTTIDFSITGCLTADGTANAVTSSPTGVAGTIVMKAPTGGYTASGRFSG